MADFAGFTRNTKKGRSNIEKIREKSQSGGKNTPTNKAALEGTELIKNIPDFLLSNILIYVMILVIGCEEAVIHSDCILRDSLPEV